MKWLRKLLVPIVPIYYGVTWLRNIFFDLGIKTSKAFQLPVICVGNLSVGGTGKTPMIEYLIRLLGKEYQIATLSRGYKRESEGFQLASKSSTAKDIGDEPFQFYNKFGKTIQVAVDSDRVNGISSLLKVDNTPDVILLDDAYQHRKVKAGFNILLTTYSNPFFKDIVLPTGDLREPRSGYKRADIIVVTKCPNTISKADKEAYRAAIKPLASQSVFFSKITYSNKVISKHTVLDITNNIGCFTLVTGIANAMPLVNFLNSKALNFEHLNYADHYDFKPADIALFETKELLITTEKDFMRLQRYDSLRNTLYYLPIEIAIDNEAAFAQLIRQYVTENA